MTHYWIKKNHVLGMVASVSTVSRFRTRTSNCLQRAGSFRLRASSVDASSAALETPPETTPSPPDTEGDDASSRIAKTARLQEHIAHSRLLELELFLLTFCTGLLDAATYSTHKVFCSKQTGNTIFIALGLFSLSPANSLNLTGIVTSLLAFTAGSAAYGWTGNALGHKKRLWLLIGNFISAALILGAATLQELASKEKWSNADQTSPAIVALCAIACGAQYSLSLNVRGPELNTSVVTSAIVALTADSRLFRVNNPGRNRKVLFFLSLVAGATSGAALTKLVGPAYVMILDALNKVAIGVLFLVNPGAETS